MAILLAVALLSLNMIFYLAHSLSMTSLNDSSCACVIECSPILYINVIHVYMPLFRGPEATIDADVFLMV